MTMAAIGITAAVGAGLSMAKAVIQKKPFGSVLTDGLIGGAIGGVTGGAGLGVSSLLGESIKQAATPVVSGAITDAAAQAAAPIVSATEAASQLATPVLSEAAGQSASAIANLGQSATNTVAPSLFVDNSLGSVGANIPASVTSNIAPSSSNLLSALQEGTKLPTDSPLSQDLTSAGVSEFKPGAQSDSLLVQFGDTSRSQNLNNQAANIIADSKAAAPWTKADYTAAINAGSSTLNTGMNLAKSSPSGPANYTQNQYGPQSGASGDSLMNSLINLSRS